MKKILAFFIGSFFLGLSAVIAYVVVLNSELPQMITLDDYKPLLVSEVFDRNGEKVGEFFREKRSIVPYEEFPELLISAFLAAEDSSFYRHGGINYVAILRAFIANLKAGARVQGASTITQQVARSLLLSREKTYTRKIKEILLAYRMEANLSKQDIMFLYLNQIFLGQGSYGVAVAAQNYFRKELYELTLPEVALLAGLPKAPSAYAPLRNPARAKDRQRYVINRMVDERMISREEADEAINQPLKVYQRPNYWAKAPHFLETVRQMLIAELGEEMVVDKGLRIHTSVDLAKQQAAQEAVQKGLRELDKRQGYRGPLAHLTEPQDIAEFLMEVRNRHIGGENPFRILAPDGTLPDYGPLNLSGYEPRGPEASEDEGPDGELKPLPVLPSYIPPETYTQGIVTLVDDKWGLVFVRFAESRGLIDIESMEWAREPDPNVDSRWARKIEKPSEVLKQGDVIEVRVVSHRFRSRRIQDKIREARQDNKDFELPEDFPDFEKFAHLELEQTPIAQAALIAFDQRTEDIISLVGGYEFSSQNQLNRTIQAVRQTGSSFKPLVYAAALDRGFTPASLIMDTPIVYEEEIELEGSDDAETITRRWRPTNHSNRFKGDILFRNALIQSLNVPSVKVIEKIGVNWSADYVRRLGIFSPINLDYTLALGSSSVTLYEMTKAFAQFGRLGKRIRPFLIHSVTDQDGEEILEKVSLDERFRNEIENLEELYEERRENFLAWKKSLDGILNGKPDGEGSDPVGLFPIETQGAQGEGRQPSMDREDGEKPPVALNPRFNPAREPPLFFEDPDQLIRPETAYVITSILQASVEEEGGTGQRARVLGRPTAGKTGSTSSYYDAWFMGYTADIATGVWVGYDQERPLGRGEVGGRTALPIWIDYMKEAHEGLPVRGFPMPDGIVFASIDNETGKLPSSSSRSVVRQAFIEGTEPTAPSRQQTPQRFESQDFFREDLSE